MHVVQRYFDMWNTGDTSAIGEILDPGWVDHAHPEVGGVEGVRRSVAALRAARPGMRFEIDAVLGDGDQVAAVGAVGTTRLVWVIRLSGGRMTEMRTYQENRP